MATVKALVVWWWWAGGSNVGGWGSSWWYKYETALSVTPQAYTVTVGTWGLWWTTASAAWWDWQDSVFSSITWLGGWGGAWNSWAAKRWGGGSAWQLTWWATFTWWNAWWNWYNNSTSIGGGGGWGAWAAWQNSHTVTKQAGNGWVGISNSISGTATYYAGGGGGGGYTPSWYNNVKWTWWNWWGWNGADWQEQVWSNGTANTGWWGWWGSGWGVGNGWWGNWGSGIVIISYATNGSDWVSTSSTGGTITTSGGQTIHTFTSNGTFTMVASWATNASVLLFYINQ